MASTTTRPMTVAEFEKLPEPQAYSHELRRGEVVKVTRPAFQHVLTQHRLQRLLAEAAPDAETVFIEAPFRPLAEYELRVADVAYAPQVRWKSIPRGGQLPGAPDLVIEVLSPSNSAAEMFEKEQISLENGCREFWIVDLDRHQIKISTPEGRVSIYKAGKTIPLFFAPGKTIAVDAIFK